MMKSRNKVKEKSEREREYPKKKKRNHPCQPELIFQTHNTSYETKITPKKENKNKNYKP